MGEHKIQKVTSNLKITKGVYDLLSYVTMINGYFKKFKAMKKNMLKI